MLPSDKVSFGFYGFDTQHFTDNNARDLRQ